MLTSAKMRTAEIRRLKKTRDRRAVAGSWAGLGAVVRAVVRAGMMGDGEARRRAAQHGQPEEAKLREAAGRPERRGGRRGGRGEGRADSAEGGGSRERQGTGSSSGLERPQPWFARAGRRYPGLRGAAPSTRASSPLHSLLAQPAGVCEEVLPARGSIAGLACGRDERQHKVARQARDLAQPPDHPERKC